MYDKLSMFENSFLVLINVSLQQGLPNYFLNGPFEEIKKAMASPTRLLKNLPLKTPKIYFCSLSVNLEYVV